jgi:hypothetical protein
MKGYQVPEKMTKSQKQDFMRKLVDGQPLNLERAENTYGQFADAHTSSIRGNSVKVFEQEKVRIYQAELSD